MIRSETLTTWAQPTADEVRELLRTQGWTGATAATIAGVNPRTIRKWVGGEARINYEAWRALITAAGIAC